MRAASTTRFRRSAQGRGRRSASTLLALADRRRGRFIPLRHAVCWRFGDHSLQRQQPSHPHWVFTPTCPPPRKPSPSNFLSIGRPRVRPPPGSKRPGTPTDAGFVLEPDLDRLAFRQAGAVSVQRRGEVFLKAATVSSSLAGWRGRALTCEKPSCLRILPIVRSW